MSLIGCHVSIAGGLHKGIMRGQELECEAIQIFTSNQLRWSRHGISDPQCRNFQEQWKESYIKRVVVHCSYLINLASTGSLRRKSIDAMIKEIQTCDRLGIDDIVLHPGHYGETSVDEGIDRVAEAIVQILETTDDTRVRINLETMAGAGTVIGSRIEELSEIVDSVDRDDRTGICLDTAHLYAAGYDLRTHSSYQKFRKKVLKLFSSSSVACWHLNDTSKDLGSRIDRHEDIGEGSIGMDTFGFILNDDLWSDTPCLLETPKGKGGDRRNLSILRKLRGG